MANTQPSIFADPWNPDAPPPVSSVFAAAPPDADAAPMPAKISMASASPFASVPDAHAPNVTRMPTPLEHQVGDTNQRLQKLEWQHDNPWGTANNHPGTLGKIGHALSVAGNIAGNIFAAPEMKLIPGTQLNREAEEKSLGTRLQTLTQSQDADAKSTAETAALPQEEADAHNAGGARTRLANDQADALENAPPAEPSLAAGYAHAVNEALKAGRDPSEDPVVQHISDAITALQKQPNADAAPKTIQIEQAGKPHQMAWDAKTHKYDLDQGESGEKPQTVHVNVGEQRAEKNDVLKAYQPTLDSAERMNVMTENYEKAIKDHDQQAMLSLLANHLGMTMGLQKGARLNKDIVQEAQKSQPWLQGMAAKFDKDGYLAGVNLSPNQMRQMVGLGQSRYSEDAKKSRATAQYLGAKDDGPQRTPNASTVRYYVHIANGDGTKAKQLAADDGWSIP